MLVYHIPSTLLQGKYRDVYIGLVDVDSLKSISDPYLKFPGSECVVDVDSRANQTLTMPYRTAVFAIDHRGSTYLRCSLMGVALFIVDDFGCLVVINLFTTES